MSVNCSCATAYGKQVRTIVIHKFSELPNSKEEAKTYLRAWSAAKKKEASNESDYAKVRLLKNERAALDKCTNEYMDRAGTATPEEFIAMRNKFVISDGCSDVQRVDNVADDIHETAILPCNSTQQHCDNVEQNTDMIKDATTGNLIRMPEIDYTEFNLSLPNLDETGHTLVLFGASKSGKTTLLLNILKFPEIDDADNIVILISPNVHAQIYKNLDKKIIKMSVWNDAIVRALHRIQKKTKNKYRFTIVIDDCITEKNSKKIMELFLTLRNSKVSTIMLLQSTTLLNRNSRFNVNNLCFLKNNNDEANEQNQKFFLGSYKPFKDLKRMEDKIRLYREITNNYGMVYLNALDGELTFHKMPPPL